MRVLVCNKFYRPFGGPETVLEDTSRLLEADGHEIVPFSMQHPDNWPTKWSDYFVSQVDYHADPGLLAKVKEAGKIIHSGEAKRKVEALLDAAKPDIAHCHNIYHQLSPSIFGPMKERGIPIVMTLHDAKLACPNMLFYVGGETCERCRGGKFYNAVIHRCVFGSRTASAVCAFELYVHRLTKVYQKNVDVFISPSQFLIDAVTRCGGAGRRMLHIPNIAKVDLFTPTYDNDGYILYLGRLTPDKGLQTLIRAVSMVDGAKLVVVGTGVQADEMKALADELAPGRVQFAGFLTGEPLKRVIERCAFYVMPSQCNENCPCTILEAYSSGKPVIGSRIGGIPELINEGVDGFLFEPGNHEDIAERISALLSDPAQVPEMGKAGRERMEKAYSPQAHYRRLMAVYEELTAGRQ